jgi:hypothetical protein
MGSLCNNTAIVVCLHACMQIREVRLPYEEATGPCKARALAQALWAGEDFFLQIDSHMRFAPGWDAALLGWLAQAEADSPGGRAVLSTYPPSYEVSPYTGCAHTFFFSPCTHA